MIDLGDYWVAADYSDGDVLYIPFDTYDADMESVTIAGLAVTDIEIYKDGATTQRASDNGYGLLDTDGTDFDGSTGLHGFSVDLGDNSHASFYSQSTFWIHINAITVNAKTVKMTFRFTVGRLLKPAAAGRRLGVESDGDLTKVNTLDGHTAQTGDSYARIGAAGAGLTGLGGMSAGMKAEVNAEADTALSDYDPPTKAEMDAAHGLLATEAKQDLIDALCDTIVTSTSTTIPGLIDALNDLSAAEANAAKAEMDAAHALLARETPNTWYGDDTNGNDANGGTAWADAEATIGAAMGDAADGDTVKLERGTYSEQVDFDTANKGLSLIGVHGPAATIIQNTVKPVILESGCRLIGLGIDATSETANGIAVHTAAAKHDILLEDCIITGRWDGMVNQGGRNWTVNRCYIASGFDALNSSGAVGMTLNDCVLFSDGGYDSGAQDARGLINASPGSVVLNNCHVIVNTSEDLSGANGAIGLHATAGDIVMNGGQISVVTTSGTYPDKHVTGVLAAGTSRIQLNDVKIHTAATGAATALDLAQSGSGQLFVDGAGYDTAKTSGTITEVPPGAAIKAVTDVSIYTATVDLSIDVTNGKDEYIVQWFKDGVPLTSGVTVPKLQVIKRADGTDLIANTAMSTITAGAYKYDAVTAERTTAGEGVLVSVTATIDAATRTWRVPLSRDSAS